MGFLVVTVGAFLVAGAISPKTRGALESGTDSEDTLRLRSEPTRERGDEPPEEENELA